MEVVISLVDEGDVMLEIDLALQLFNNNTAATRVCTFICSFG